MNDFIFFYPTRHRFGGACIVDTLNLTIASKIDEQAERLRECCETHVEWLQND